jgi:hypothetical protein
MNQSLDYPPLKLESKNLDKDFNKMIELVYNTLVIVKKISYKDLIIEEKRASENFIYFFENKKLKLMGYVVKNRKEPRLYDWVIQDNSRFSWAEKEGFIDNCYEIKNRDLVYHKIGVFIKVDGLRDFVNFLSGEKAYTFLDKYIKTESSFIS